MKFLLLMVVLTLPLWYLFGEDEYRLHTESKEISRYPGVVKAEYQKIITTKTKNDGSYRVQFRYKVNGQQYHLTTTSTDQKGALEYAAQRITQVAYSTRNPSIGMLKRYFDFQHKNGSLAQSLTVTFIFSVLLALPIAAVVSWRLGWFKRKKQT